MLSDRLYVEATRSRRGDQRAAVLAYCRPDTGAAAGDARRLAQVALAAAGEGFTTGMDATDAVVSLLLDEVAIVPKAPTPARSRLLSRLAVGRATTGRRTPANTMRRLPWRSLARSTSPSSRPGRFTRAWLWWMTVLAPR